VIITFILSIILYRSLKNKPTKKQLVKALKPWAIGIILINIIPLAYFNISAGPKENYDEDAKVCPVNVIHIEDENGKKLI